jgi:heme o synthase
MAMGATLRAIGAVLKLRIGVFCALAAVAGALATPKVVPPALPTVAVAVAVLLAAASAGAFNHYWEWDLDQRMARTRRRPFVTGRFRRGPAWLAAMAGLLVAGVALAAVAVNGLAALYVFLGAFIYGVVYTVWLKRRTRWNIVVGGLSGSFAVLAGSATASLTPSPEALLLTLVLFLWTPPHFWSLASALRDDYAAAGVPMLPVVTEEKRTNQIILANATALVIASLLPFCFGAGWIYLIAAALGGGWLLYTSFHLLCRPSRKAAMANFFASLVQLSAVLCAILVEPAFG